MEKEVKRVLHYLPGLPPVRVGGLSKYALDLAEEEQTLGYETGLLVPGRYSHFYNGARITRTKWKNMLWFQIINPLPVSSGKRVYDVELLYKKGNEKLYENFLKEFQPDIIHIHSLMGIHIEFMQAAHKMNIPIVYTTHDYYGICPNAILLKNMKQCMNTDGSQCSTCMSGGLTTKKIEWQQSSIYRSLKKNSFVNWLEYSQKLVPIKIKIRTLINRKNTKKSTECNENTCNEQKQEYCELQKYYREMFKYVDKFHFNSTQTKEIFEKYLGNLSGEVILISNKNIEDNRVKHKYGKILRIGFIGRGEYKGFGVLKEALDNLYLQGMRDIECHVYFNPKEKLPPYIISHRPFKENEAFGIYNNIDILVLPSIWKETFGMVVPEALSYGVPVIVSDNAGAKELLKENNTMGIIVKPTHEELQSVLSEIYCNRSILEKMNNAICGWKMEFDFDNHVNKITDFYRGVAE